MENSAYRRLNSVFRHLLQQPSEEETNLVLHRVLLSSSSSSRQLDELHEETATAEPVIIGGMVLDIHGIPSVPANPRTTTPGKVNYVLGGVARNVAESMSKLGAIPYLISALGLDLAGNILLEHWSSAGLSTEGIRRQNDIDTAVVSNILDVKGEVAAGVASFQSIEKFLTPEWIQQSIGNISSAPVLMIDANLSLPALEASCQMASEHNIPVWFEPVSVTKSRRITTVVEYISVASPNEDELVAMANALCGESMFHPIDRNKHSAESSFQTLKPAILVLLESGIKLVVLTLGSDGVLLCSKESPISLSIVLRNSEPRGISRKLYGTATSRCPSNWYSGAMEPAGGSQFFALHFPALPASVVRLTGAGDCLVGGTLASMCAGLDVMQSVSVGIAAAKAAVEAETNVPSQFNLTAIADDARTVYAAAKLLPHQSML